MSKRWFYHRPLQLQQQTELPLEGGKCFYAVIDAEAIVLSNVVNDSGNLVNINVVESIAFVLYNIDGTQVWGERHEIYQPHNAEKLAKIYGVRKELVQTSYDAYKRITGDPNPVHADPLIHKRWCEIRKHIQRACEDHAIVVYAKGTTLEASIFYGAIEFVDLALYGCPKYPYPVHDPFKECQFFAQFIPEIRARASGFAYGYFWAS